MTLALDPTIRNGVRAIIMRDGCVLLQRKYRDDYGERFTLPGGGQEAHETLIEAVHRECLEEIGIAPTVEKLLHVADLYKNKTSVKPPIRRHFMEFWFSCTVPADYVAKNGPHPDKTQTDVIWMPLSDLPNKPFFPPQLGKVLSTLDQQEAVYLGLVGPV